jgi:hypothetical protein
MGTFVGHIIPGTIFIVLGFWWSFLITLRYIHIGNKNLNKIKTISSNYTMQWLYGPICLQKLPIESVLKFLLSFFGILFETTTGLSLTYYDSTSLNQNTTEATSHSDHHKRQIEPTEGYKFTIGSDSLQHVTMYLAFLIGSIVEILVHYKVHLPHRLDYICGILSFTVEAFLFKFHSLDDDIAILVHTLLVLAIYGCIISTILEYSNPDKVIFTYGRAAFTFLQGTWFYEISFILYPPVESLENRWDPGNHMHLMFITVSFIWHFLFVFISFLLQFLILNNFYAKKHSTIIESYTNPLFLKSIKNSNNMSLYYLSDDEIDNNNL